MSGNITEDKQMQSMSPNVIRINVGGTQFKCFAETLGRFPESKLAKLNRNSQDFDELNDEYFFDRNPLIFSFILDSFRTGAVHLPKDICGWNFKEELKFWDISLRHVAPCCWEALYKAENDVKTIQSLTENYKLNTNMCLLMKEKKSFREKMWLLLDEPKSSRFALIWGFFMSTAIILSTVVSATGSVSAILTDTYSEEKKQTMLNIIEIGGWNIPDNQTRSGIAKLTLERPPVLFYMNTCCFTILSFEILLMFIFSPRKCDLFKSWLRMLEMVSYIAFWISFVTDRYITEIKSDKFIRAYICFKYISILKLVRLLRIAKHIPVFNIIVFTFRSCTQELKVLAFMLSLLTAVFGYAMYISEFFNSNEFENVYIAMYWALITLTTVGYGDYVPSSAVGHVIAAICAICGVLVLALPIGVIAASFNSFYAHHKYASKHIKANRVCPQMFAPAK